MGATEGVLLKVDSKVVRVTLSWDLQNQTNI